MESGFQGEGRKKRQAFYQKSAWKRIRKIQLSKQPLCENCWKIFKRQTVATVCDHIDPAWETWYDFCKGPFQSLCRACHDEKTKFEDVVELKRKKLLEVKFYG